MGVLCVVHGLCGVLSTGCGVVWCGGWLYHVDCVVGGWVFFVRYVVNGCTLCCTWIVWCDEHWVWCGVVGGCTLWIVWLVGVLCEVCGECVCFVLYMDCVVC